MEVLMRSSCYWIQESKESRHGATQTEQYLKSYGESTQLRPHCYLCWAQKLKHGLRVIILITYFYLKYVNCFCWYSGILPELRTLPTKTGTVLCEGKPPKDFTVQVANAEKSTDVYLSITYEPCECLLKTYSLELSKELFTFLIQ